MFEKVLHDPKPVILSIIFDAF